MELPKIFHDKPWLMPALGVGGVVVLALIVRSRSAGGPVTSTPGPTPAPTPHPGSGGGSPAPDFGGLLASMQNSQAAFMAKMTENQAKSYAQEQASLERLWRSMQAGLSEAFHQTSTTTPQQPAGMPNPAPAPAPAPGTTPVPTPTPAPVPTPDPIPGYHYDPAPVDYPPGFKFGPEEGAHLPPAPPGPPPGSTGPI